MVYLLPVYEAGESLYEILYGRPSRRRGLLYLYTLFTFCLCMRLESRCMRSSMVGLADGVVCYICMHGLPFACV